MSGERERNDGQITHRRDRSYSEKRLVCEGQTEEENEVKEAPIRPCTRNKQGSITKRGEGKTEARN